MYRKPFTAPILAILALVACLTTSQPAKAYTLNGSVATIYGSTWATAVNDITLGGQNYNVTFVEYGGDYATETYIDQWLPTLDPYNTDINGALEQAVTNDFNLKGITDVYNTSGQLSSAAGMNGEAATPGVYFYFPVSDVLGDNYYPVAYAAYSVSTQTWIPSSPDLSKPVSGVTAGWAPVGSDTFAFVSLSTSTAPLTSPVPEPTTVLLLGLGLIFLAGSLRKSKRQIHMA